MYRLSARFDVSAQFTFGTGDAVTLPIATFDATYLNARSVDYWIRSSEYAIEETAYGPRNRFRLPDYSRLDLGATFYFTAENPPVEHSLLVPYIPGITIPLGAVGYIVFVTIVIVSASNGVNLTDGLDGLAIMPAVLVGAALGVFAYAAGNVIYSTYLGIPYVAGSGELLVFCAALAGAGLGFLWFNTYPAQVFMGDIGALALGAALGLVAVAVRQELVLFVMGGVFVVESVSVIIQVASYKMTGRRIFRMAPLHHHFELKGWPEPKVIVRFWIITVILVLVGLASLKIR